jgi:hypothetical protein
MQKSAHPFRTDPSNAAEGAPPTSAGRRNRRALMSMEEIRTEINLVDDALSALAELLQLIPNEKVSAWSLYILLKPWHDKLRIASCDLNDAH